MDIRFNGKIEAIQDGDTVASALYRAGQRIFTRSFKYHRPRGLLCCAGTVSELPDERGRHSQRPHLHHAGARGHEGEAPERLAVARFDYFSVAQHFDWMMPVGWYYKTFTNPRMWHLAEPHIRKVAGLGDAPPPDTPEAPTNMSHMKADVAVIGGGSAGMSGRRRSCIRRGASGGGGRSTARRDPGGELYAAGAVLLLRSLRRQFARRFATGASPCARASG